MPEAPESNANSEAPAKKSKTLLIIILLLLLVACGGAGGFFFLRARAATAPGKSKDKNAKKQSSKDDEEEADKEASDEKQSDEKHADEKSSSHSDEKENDKKGSKQSLDLSLPDDSDVKQVVELQPFIINLADEGEARYLRMTVSLGLGENEGESKPDPLMTTKVRNAMITVLTSKRSEEILTVAGKTALRKELLKAARAAVKEPEVHAIYITDFIVQL